MGNSKNKKGPKKRRASNNSKCSTSSDQKENVPKNEKTRRIKPEPNEGIEMSKQLLLKKSNVRAQRRSSSKPDRICANGKPLPSLTELEKMFEDSDDDQPPETPTQKPTCTTSTPEKHIPKSNGEKHLLSPTTINQITERIMGSIQKQNLPDPSELIEATSLLRAKTPPPPPVVPPKKRKKPDVPYIVGCKDRPKVIRKPNTNFCKGYDDYGVEASSDPEEDTPTKRAKKSRIPKYSKSIFNAHSDEIAERLTNDDAGGLSDASTDSNKTIEYNPTLFQTSRPHSFSPLPSTSTDSETFRKNDDLFNESLKEINISKESTPKVTEDDLPMIKLSPSTKKEHDFLITKEPTPKEEDDVLITNIITPKKKDNFLIKNLLTPTKRDEILITKQSTLEKKEDDVQIIDIAYDTIEIEDVDERTVRKQHTSNTIDTNIIEIIEPEQSEVVKSKEETIIHKIIDDEECMIVSSSETIKNHNNFKLNEPIVIDDEYSTINTEFIPYKPIEIIDVENILAENRSILEKRKNFTAKVLNMINTVVDVPTTSKNVAVAPQITITPSTTAQTTVKPSTTAQTTVKPSTTAQTTVKPSTTAQTTVKPSTAVQTVRPNITHQIISTPSSTPQARVTTNSTIPSTSIPKSSKYLITTRNKATLSKSTQKLLTSLERSLTFQNILKDYFKSPHDDIQRATVAFKLELAALYCKNGNRSNSNGTPSQSVNYNNNNAMPVLTNATPVSTNATPVSTNATPISINTTPVSINATPVSTNATLVSNNAIPVSTNATPVSINATPVSINASPVSTNANPVSINAFQRPNNRRRFELIEVTDSPSHSPSHSPLPSRNIGDCPICLDPLHSCNGIASTICGHVFCLKCIQASVKTNGRKCPTCRKALKGAGGYHQLYL